MLYEATESKDISLEKIWNSVKETRRKWIITEKSTPNEDSNSGAGVRSPLADGKQAVASIIISAHADGGPRSPSAHAGPFALPPI